MKHLLTIALSVACITIAFAVPVRFNADVSHAATYSASAYRGETLDIEAVLSERGRAISVPTGTAAALYWQTNGMASAWWTAPANVSTAGVIRATWSPTNDVGAAAYRVFLGVGDSNRNYRANMTLRMVGSPGANPNTLAPPIQMIDFAAVAVTNAPWALPYVAGENVTINGRVISATGGGGGGISTNEVRGVVTNTVTRAYVEGLGISGGGGMDSNAVMRIIDAQTGGTNSLVHATFEGDAMLFSQNVGISRLFSATDDPLAIGSSLALDETLGLLADYIGPSSGASVKFNNVQYESSLTPDGSAVITANTGDNRYAQKAWVIDTIGGTNTWMAINGEELSIYTKTNAISTNVLWTASSGIGTAVSNLNVTVNNHTSRITSLEARPDLTSWGNYAPDGTANPDPGAMLYLNKAMTLMGSGFSWATSGTYACLCQSGSVAFLTSTNGEVRIGTDVTTNYFGLVQGATVTVGCHTDGIRVSGNVVTLDYDYAGGAFPVIWFTGDLVTTEWVETTPVWVDNGDGTATATLPRPSGSKGFFKATSTRETGAMFRSNVPAYFPAGVYGGLANDPVEYDSVITIQSNGHTYRIPAELVQ